MDSDNQLVIYCEDDGEYRIYCKISDSLCLERFYKNHLISQTHVNNIRKREKFQIFSYINVNNKYY